MLFGQVIYVVLYMLWLDERVLGREKDILFVELFRYQTNMETNFGEPGIYFHGFRIVYNKIWDND